MTVINRRPYGPAVIIPSLTPVTYDISVAFGLLDVTVSAERELLLDGRAE
jgi:hypothetical protein